MKKIFTGVLILVFTMALDLISGQGLERGGFLH